MSTLELLATLSIIAAASAATLERFDEVEKVALDYNQTQSDQIQKFLQHKKAD